MSFRSGAVTLGTSDTNIFECPATFSGAAKLTIANVAALARTYTLKLYKASTASTVTLVSGASLSANSAAQTGLTATLEAGDKLIGSASAASSVVVTAAVSIGPSSARVGLEPKGEYSAGTTYEQNDVVNVAGVGSFISMQGGNVGNTPASSPAYWMYLAETGAQGPAGVAGASALAVVRVVSTGSASYATDFENGDTIDGVALATNDLVLRASATDPERNGVYVVQASGAASRHTDFATYDSICGAFFSVMEGTAYADTLWQCTSNRGGTLNTTALTIQSHGSGVRFDTAQSLSSAERLQALTNLGIPGITTAVPQGRLTLTTGVARPTSDVSGATTMYYTPAAGNMVPIFDGSAFVPTSFSELSNATAQSSTGKAGPAAVANNSNYDLFVWNDAGTVRLTRGPAWTSSTARGTGAGTTELELVNGLLVNKIAITNGPAVQRGTYVGTIRSNGTATIDLTFGSTAAGGGPAVVGVWNAYNQASFHCKVGDSTANWSLTSWDHRPMNNSTGNRISFVTGLAVHPVQVVRGYYHSLAAASGAQASSGFTLDSITSSDRNQLSSSQAASVLIDKNFMASFVAAQLGFHYIQAMERSDNTNSNTFAGSSQNVFFEATLWA